MPKQTNSQWIRQQNRKALEKMRQDITVTTADYARAVERALAVGRHLEQEEAARAPEADTYYDPANGRFVDVNGCEVRDTRINRVRKLDDLRRIQDLAGDLRTAAIAEAAKLTGATGPGRPIDLDRGTEVLARLVERLALADRVEATVWAEGARK